MSIEEKATALVLRGDVTVEDATFDRDGTLLRARGTVLASDGRTRYTVQASRDFSTCDCKYGAGGTRVLQREHSHDKALRIAAQVAQEREEGTGHE